MKKSKIFSSIGVVTAAALTLVACGKSNNSSSNGNDVKTASKFPAAVPTKATKKGGTVKIGELSASPFTGIFAPELSTMQTDTDVAGPGLENLFDTDDNFKINDKGPATFKLDRKTKTVTIEIKKGVKWSDGKQVVAKDIEYPYEITANKATQSQRYTASLADIVGLADYHNGKTKTIKGIEMPDGENGLKVILHFKQMKPGMYNSGNGYFIEDAEPYHYLKDVPFAKLMSSDKIRKNPLFYGPYKLDKVVRGQSTTWSPNKYYWRGTPKLDKIVIQVVSPDTASQALKSHKFDIINVRNAQWKQVKGTKGVNFVASIPLSYYYLGFKVGKWSNKQGKSVMDKNPKMTKPLRQAIGYAMNVNEVDKHYTDGLSFRVPTLIPAQFGDYFNKDSKGYPYDLKKANEILDKAGYKKKGKWRVQPNGKPLTITFLAMQGSAIQEPTVQNYIQQWHKIGLNVKLYGGRLTEANAFYDKLQKSDPGFDMFEAGWVLSTEPSPNDIYNEAAPFNYSHFVTEKNNKLLDEMNSEKAFDHNYRVQKFHEWQDYMNEEAYVIPMDNAYGITAVNNKLTGYSKKPSMNNTLYYDIAYAK
ncbi:oligopeptide ABC transporter substrate-binding protein [Lactobacillus sp. ESL0791]|uniref:oligopeptide ABC transporter substrate-binding protein n=1 Tax=Lactobacillus sp. ESL0791 TaxID=2983234 RepID=UPI0023F707A8|nr:oligopeptide ABC transporter substrate-binding protein [Lactobacillus sp. ESL0791]MDF7638751.1 oligopeptide ABC transporter substrate-binding protein [Lactobacillus sp. ESL0791]